MPSSKPPLSKVQKDYAHLQQLSRHTKSLEGVLSILGWDQETKMPKKGAKIRGEQRKNLAGVIHREKIGKPFEQALSKLIDIPSGKILQKGLSSSQQKALDLWRRDYLHAVALPASFVEEFAQLSAESIFAWEQAKIDNDFKSFLPYLKKIVTANRKKADYLAKSLGCSDHPYDALLDLYEPGMTTKDVQGLFSPLKKSILSLVKKIQSVKQIPDDFIHETFPAGEQFEFGKILLHHLGYSEDRGRIDLSSHPFCSSSHSTDCRITTRILPQMPLSNIRTVLHECGHAFYEMGLPQESFGSPLGEAISLGVHESQSRFWETRIGMSSHFWSFCLPLLKKHFKGKLEKISLNQIWKAVNKVSPSLIRVEADEVTYALHVILRFELEIAFIEGNLQPKDLPEAWKEKTESLLKIAPKNDREGCLQDIHWPMGAFGYFSTYALGNLYASHIFEAFEKHFPDWGTRVEKGDFAFIKEWLNENIYQHGRLYTSLELMKKVTGKPFSSKAFEEYLLNKYQTVYQF